MSEYWYIISDGDRRGEKVLAKLNDAGLIVLVASAYCDGNRYTLYPIHTKKYYGYPTVNNKSYVSIFDVRRNERNSN